MEPKEYTIEQLREFSSEAAEAIRNLAKQLGANAKQLTDTDVQEMLQSSCNNLFVAYNADKKIVGMVTVMIYRIPYTKKAYIEDLVVHESFRGKGLGTDLLTTAIEFAKEKGAAYADFTSHMGRDANVFYEKLGFKKRDTNVYRIDYSYEQD